MKSGNCKSARDGYVSTMALPIVHAPAYDADFPTGHRFPMAKYSLLARRLVDDGLVTADGFHVPAPAPKSWVKLAHDSAYVDQVYAFDVPPHIQKIVGFEMTQKAIIRAQSATTGTVMAARLALDHGIACNTAGGSHHAGLMHGAGFCTFNDVAVAAKVLLADGEITSALIVDLDVHQGDGTAEIFSADERVFTFSMHAERNYPDVKRQSDFDMALPDGMADHAYLKQLTLALETLRRDGPAPGLVFYNAGVDVHADDRLGRLALSNWGIEQRDRMVISHFRSRNIPVTGVIGGGYSMNAQEIADRHAILFHVASEFAL